MTDLVEKLRGRDVGGAVGWVSSATDLCLAAADEIEKLRALLETANAYGAGENAARIAAEEELAEKVRQLDVLANEMEYRGNSVAFIYQKKDAYAAALDRAFDELRKRNVPIDGKTPLATIIGNELDRLRAEVADKIQVAATIATERALLQLKRDRLRELLLRFKRSVYDPGPVLVADIDAALKEQKK